ncbi:MAG: CBS domain-containing protein [Alphaproteobacteria bacterium]|nr:CBS domain-containing protein [Alphaproteobacteria bacterium]MCB9930822.1 CBS domain-containing protein [Alphaproteobacteria bacterium]
MQASDVMTSDVASVTPKTTVREIAAVMLKRQISGVPVVDGNRHVVGIVSEGDLMRRIEDRDASSRSWWLSLFSTQDRSAQDYVKRHGRYADEIMTRNVIAIEEGTALSEIATVLERHRIKRVPVTRDGKLVGIVSRSNLLRGLASQTDMEAASPGDRGIREQVEAELSKGVKLDMAFVSVVVKDGAVKLWGLVDTPAERQAAQVAAENTPGVRSVENNLGQVPEWIWAE